MIKTIFTDLDDTFLYDLEAKKNRMYQIPQRSLDALKQIQDQDIRVVIATGRLYGEVIELLKRNQINLDFIALDGAVCFEKENSNLIDYAGIDSNDALEVIDVLQKNEIEFMICDDRNYYGMHYQWNWLPEAIKSNELEITRFVIQGNQNYLDKAIEVLKDFDQYDIFNYPGNIILQSKNTSKGKAILRYCLEHDLNIDEVCVFGDGINDESMFETVETSVFISHGKSKRAKELSTYQAKDFLDGWLQIK